ncbi:Kinesin motor domain [Carpediemonas membranifera]|uniref:Kinesin-like protein n=1 Tax=Carpediemonas membranifera TaxID=201153 RepID=A0A8J6B664_9EUKA|nr:Kinesin motor domain [Carpediemonas membranifera]|eukprot:KAG9390837.1 Kinesin motor domain [Carpediemonas membranifera]
MATYRPCFPDRLHLELQYFAAIHSLMASRGPIRQNQYQNRPTSAPPAPANILRNEVKRRFSNKVIVVVRVRPHLANERAQKATNILHVIDDKSVSFDPREEGEVYRHDVWKRQATTFGYDAVFPRTSSQWDVYAATSQKVIEPVLAGFNASVFAYGATGSGKTYTMMGDEKEGVSGIMMLTLIETFKQIDQMPGDKRFSVSVSYIEIYNEKIRDLLDAKKRDLPLREDRSRGTIVAGATERVVHSSDGIIDILREGAKIRTEHSTAVNEHSSRSHAVLQIKVTHRAGSGTRVGKLSLVDLAGSERASRTGNKGDRLAEGAAINKSLLSLANCINALCQPRGKAGHIPFRDSKLTRMLKDSLGGHCMTCMIANVSPASVATEETFNTLVYAGRARNIKSKATKAPIEPDRGMTPEQAVGVEAELEKLKTRIAQLEKENASLKAANLSASDGIQQHSVFNKTPPLPPRPPLTVAMGTQTDALPSPTPPAVKSDAFPPRPVSKHAQQRSTSQQSRARSQSQVSAVPLHPIPLHQITSSHSSGQAQSARGPSPHRQVTHPPPPISARGQRHGPSADGPVAPVQLQQLSGLGVYGRSKSAPRSPSRPSLPTGNGSGRRSRLRPNPKVAGRVSLQPLNVEDQRVARERSARLRRIRNDMKVTMKFNELKAEWGPRGR